METTFFADIPGDIEEEILFLYKLGVDVDEIEYLISKRLRNVSS